MKTPALVSTKCDPEQLHQVYSWILAGASEHEIVEAARQQWPDLDARPLILCAADELAKAGDADPAILYGWCIESTRELYQRMREIGDFAGALRAVKQLHDLAGARS